MKKAAGAGLAVILVLALVVGSAFYLGTMYDPNRGTDPEDPIDPVVDPPTGLPDPPAGEAVLVFYVLLDGNPVTGATCRVKQGTVTIAEKQTTDGTVHFVLPVGEYRCRAIYGAYKSALRPVTLTDVGAHATFDFTSTVPQPSDPDNPSSTDKGILNVITKLDDVERVVDIRIIDRDTLEIVKEGKSGQSYSLPVGTYKVKVWMPVGPTTTLRDTRSADVTAGMTTYLTFEFRSRGLSIFGLIGSTGVMVILIVAAAYLYTNPKALRKVRF